MNSLLRGNPGEKILPWNRFLAPASQHGSTYNLRLDELIINMSHYTQTHTQTHAQTHAHQTN